MTKLISLENLEFYHKCLMEIMDKKIALKTVGSTTCPHCGAPINDTKCPYCGTDFTKSLLFME